MSDYDDNDDSFDDDETPAPPVEKTKSDKGWRRRLEAEAEEGRKAQAEAAQAKKELAFLRAGVDLTTPQGKLFAKAYDGDPTADAVKTAALEYGVIEAPAEQVPAEELAAHDRFANASAGGNSNPSDEQRYFSDLDRAESPAEVLAVLKAAGIVPENDKPGRWVTGNGRTAAVNPL